MEEKGLKHAFALFSQESYRLKTAYRTLQKKIDMLDQKLLESDQTLEVMIDHMLDGLIFLNREGCIQFFNPAAEKLTGKMQNQVLGLSYIIHFSDTVFGFSIGDALKKKNVHTRSLISFQGANQEREMEVTASSITEKGLLILLRDRTEIRQLEQSVQRNDRLKELGEMAATLAHEIRNPLGGIEGFASLIAQDLKDNSHFQPMIQGILSGVKAVNTLITNVLDYARPLNFHFSATNLVWLVQEICDMMNVVPIKNCHCVFQCHENVVMHSVDQERFKVALCHLIRNAFEASTENSQVVVKLEKNKILIQDTGKGIKREHLEMIFTPFFTTKISGSGLGLSEAHKIIQAHGGTIEVESSYGYGTTMLIKLPKYYGEGTESTETLCQLKQF